MVKTPWGDAEELRSKQLPPGPRTAREEVVRSQRERLQAAMVAVSSERGYEASTVADLVRLSGVSRADYYKHFENKRACFIAALEEILKRAMAIVALRYDGQGTALADLIGLIVDQPAAAKLCFVESYAAGPEAIAAMEGAVAGVEALYERAFAAADGAAEMPPEVVRGIVGGLRKVIHTRLRQGREEELLGLGGQLWEWSSGYGAPPTALRRGRTRPGEPGRHLPADPAERIIVASAETVAERGYPATTVAEIVARAGVSFSTFSEHFDGKEDAVVAALDAGQARLFGVMAPAYRRAREWPAAVRAAYEAMFAFFAAEPDFAQMAMVEVFAAGERAMERRDRTIEALGRFLAPGYERSPRTSPIAAEAIGGAAYALVYDQIRRRGPASLPGIVPHATYLTLAPFLGAAEAGEVANIGGRRRRSDSAPQSRQ